LADHEEAWRAHAVGALGAPGAEFDGIEAGGGVHAADFGDGEAVAGSGAGFDFAVADEGVVDIETGFGGIVAGLAEGEDVAGAVPAFGLPAWAGWTPAAMPVARANRAPGFRARAMAWRNLGAASGSR